MKCGACNTHNNSSEQTSNATELIKRQLAVWMGTWPGMTAGAQIWPVLIALAWPHVATLATWMPYQNKTTTHCDNTHADTYCILCGSCFHRASLHIHMILSEKNTLNFIKVTIINCCWKSCSVQFKTSVYEFKAKSATILPSLEVFVTIYCLFCPVKFCCLIQI